MTKYIIFLIISISPAMAMETEKTFSFVAFDYPPYISDELISQKNSWVWDVVRAALEPQGYVVKVTFMPWARGLEETKAGNFDGIYGAFLTDERLKWFEFGDPIGQATKIFLKRKNRSDINFAGDLTSLKGLLIGVPRGFVNTLEFDRANYLNKYILSPEGGQGIKMLMADRLDVLIVTEEVARYRIDNLNFEYSGLYDTLEFVRPYLQKRNLHMAISKKSSKYLEKTQDLNVGLARIKLNGTYKRIKERYSFK